MQRMNMVVHLIWAAKKGDKGIVELLLQNDADVNAKDEYGSTALNSAAYVGDERIVELLLQNNANINYKRSLRSPSGLSAPGYTALDVAKWHGHKKVVEVLLKDNPDVNFNDFFKFLEFGIFAKDQGFLNYVMFGGQTIYNSMARIIPPKFLKFF